MPRMTKSTTKKTMAPVPTATTGTPLCPKCDHIMQLRESKKNDSTWKFWGCSSFPKCNGYRAYQHISTDRTNIVKPENIKGSPEQVAIWDVLVEDSRHIIIEAVA